MLSLALYALLGVAAGCAILGSIALCLLARGLKRRASGCCGEKH